jgi:hypothetical protein
VNLTETQICEEIPFAGFPKFVRLYHFDELLDLDQFSDVNPDDQNTTVIREANDGKLMFSYECA